MPEGTRSYLGPLRRPSDTTELGHLAVAVAMCRRLTWSGSLAREASYTAWAPLSIGMRCRLCGAVLFCPDLLRQSSRRSPRLGCSAAQPQSTAESAVTGRQVGKVLLVGLWPRRSRLGCRAADGQQLTAVGIVTTLGEPWRIVEAAGR
jgi:hypothetical protein